jgi:hypothetical protein
MTIRQKHSRRISIDGVDYRWVVRDRPTYMQAVGMSNLSVAVEQSDAPDCVLRIVLPAARKDNWLLAPGYVIKPSDLRRWIPKALAAGWLPRKKGPGFELHLTDSDLNADQRLGEKLAQPEPEA